MSVVADTPDPRLLKREILDWGRELGFQAIGVAHVDLGEDEKALQRWLALCRHGEMEWMARHGSKRTRPDELVPGTLSVICARMDYLPADAAPMQDNLDEPQRAYVSRYALGRDYHKLIRARLQKLAERIQARIGPFGHRVFTDSAPVLEKPLARNAGLGWQGKHTNLIDSKTGSWFFLGELYTDLPLASDERGNDHCGTCTRCISACPTGAIVAPYELDARLCISYLTIELQGAIPAELRPLIGNRIYGCDDCQMVCPWNKFASATAEPDFAVRNGLDRATLVELFAWDEAEFLHRTEGSPIRRIGHERWLRNIAVALGNAPTAPDIIDALRSRADHPSEMLRDHVDWALARHDITDTGASIA